MHYYKRNLGDYAKKAGRLSMLQHGSYTLLIDACYDREQFPTMGEAIEWTWASTTAEVEAVKFVLRKFFTLEDGRYVQKRIQEEIGAYHGMSATNKRIAQEREANRNAPSTKREQSVNEAPPNQEPLTTNQEPETKETKARAPRKPSAYAALNLTVSDLISEGVDKDHAAAWFVVRKDKGAKHLSKVAWDALKDEATKAGITSSLAVHICVIANWQGFRSSWDWRPFAPDGSIPPGAPTSPVTPRGPINRQAALEEQNRKVASEWAANMKKETANASE